MLVCVRSCVRRRILLCVDTRRYCRLKASVQVQFDIVIVTFAASFAGWSPARHDRVPPRTGIVATAVTYQYSGALYDIKSRQSMEVGGSIWKSSGNIKCMEVYGRQL